MTPEHWQRVKELLRSALEREPSARAAYLLESCGDDAALRAEIESLVAAYEEDPSCLEEPALLTVAPASEGDLAELGPARRIGPYELDRVIASGGMGTVCLAVRADDEYRKQVAIKVIRSDPYGDPRRRDELRRRFRTERQLLANLDHPNIARLLDGGTTEAGAPYLVMDYIDGQPIDVYADAHKLSTVERVRLFRTTCSAVQYAHQNLVIHRDLKPSNILVTGDGVPHLLDFGVAKLLDPDSSALAGGLTQTGVQPMTPAYASPEQFQGQPVTTTSDVYSLGVVLYELLTGHRPYRIGKQAPHEIARVVCEQEPEKPSTVVTRTEVIDQPDGTSQITLTPQSVSQTRDGRPDRLRRRLAGDIDMIVLMALRKEPQRRYASVEQFSEDIRRHLAGLPVMAHKDTLAYRGVKFARRHAGGVAAAALIALALVIGIVGTAWQAHVAQLERETAQRAQDDEQRQRKLAEANLERAAEAEAQAAMEAETARTVSRFLEELFWVADPFQGSSLTEAQGTEIPVGEFLERGGQRITTELEGQPAIQATLMDTIGRIYNRLGDYGQAERLLRASLETRRETFGPEHLEVADSLSHLANVLLDQGEHAAAEPLFREALAMRRRLLGHDDGPVAATLSHLARLLQATGDYEEAERLHREALELYRELYGDEHAYVAVGLGNLAGLLRVKGHLADAEQAQKEALEILRSVHGDEHPDVAMSLNNLATLLIDQGRYDEAEPLYRESLTIHQQLLGDEHPNVAESLSNLAAVLEARGRFDEAQQRYGEALAMRRALLAEDHPAIATTLNNLAHLYYVTGRYGDAEPLFREALEIRRQRLGNQHPDTALSLHNLASTLNFLGDPATAESLFRQALAIRREVLGDRHAAVAETLANLGGMRYARSDCDEAKRLLTEALDIRRQQLGPEHPVVASTLNALGAVVRDMGDLASAEPMLREALTIQRKIWPQGHPAIASTLTSLGVVLTRAGSPEDGEPLLREALAIRQAALPEGHWLTANTASNLGGCLTALRRYEEAERLLVEGYTVLQAQRGDRDERTRQALRRLIDLYEGWGQPEKAATYRALWEESRSP
jgi:serine/threonine-protein kinase